MDLLSDVFSSLRLRGDLYFLTEFSGKWGVTIPPDRRTIRFHLVAQGQCWVVVDGSTEPVLLNEGDFALIPHGATQTLSSVPEQDPIHLADLMSDGNPGTDGVLRYGSRDGGQQCRLVCGFCSFDEHLNHPLFLGLPPIIILGVQSTGDSPWLAEAIRVTTMEANLADVGMRDIISRLIEVLFIQAIRHQLRMSSNDGNPFLIAITDKKLLPAIQAMHGHFESDWTISRLAEISGMSRTQFARRFRDVLDQTPMQYLTDWRLQKARQWLKETDSSVADIGLRSGYQSLPSFTRRFTERFGVSPAAFRRQSYGLG